MKETIIDLSAYSRPDFTYVRLNNGHTVKVDWRKSKLGIRESQNHFPCLSETEWYKELAEAERMNNPEYAQAVMNAEIYKSLLYFAEKMQEEKEKQGGSRWN